MSMASVTGTTRPTENSMANSIPAPIPPPIQDAVVSAKAVPASPSVGKTLKSYFFWTHQRGSFHYDVMVTLILAFIFTTPWWFNYGDKAAGNERDAGPIQVVGDGQFGLTITVPAQNVHVDLNASDRAVRSALHVAVQPVTGDDISIDRWETVPEAAGHPAAWKIWAHR
jgi:hypothetical protein